MENKIKVIPLTAFQKKLYAVFVETHASIVLNVKGLKLESLIRKSEKISID